MKFQEIKHMTQARYASDIDWEYLQNILDRYSKEYNLDLNPEFQRGHVWTEQQQIDYVEYILRNGQSGRDIYFNCPGWMHTMDGQMVLVDGKQRITAVLKFLNDEIKAFGLYHSEYEGRIPFDCGFKFHINDLSFQDEILQWYIDINSGVAHTTEEIEKVRQMIKNL